MSAAGLDQRAYQPWGNSRTTNTQKSVTATASTHACNARTTEIMVSNLGPNVAFLDLAGTGTTNGIVLPVNVPLPFLVEPGATLGLVCDTGKTASVNIAEKQAG